jgi:hypothetical protein
MTVGCLRCGIWYDPARPHVCGVLGDDIARGLDARLDAFERRLQGLEVEARSRLNKLEEIAARLPAEVKAQGPRVQPAASSADPEIPRLMGTWVQVDDDIARSLAERKPSAPPREEGIALEPKKKRVQDRAHHAKYMRAWRSRQYLRKHGIPA